MSLDLDRIPRWAPGPQARVNWSHPLAQGLRHCWTGRMVVDHATGLQLVNVGSPERGVTAFGEAATVSGGAAIQSADASILTGSGSDATVCIAGRINSWVGEYTTIIDKSSGGADGRDFSIFVNSSGTVTYTHARQTGSATAVALALPAGARFALTAVVTDASKVMAYWLNGLYMGSSGTLGDTGQTTPSVMSLCKNVSGGGSDGDATFSACHVWTRALDANEIAALYADPFCMFRED